MTDRELLALAAKAAGHTLYPEWDCAASGILLGQGCEGDMQRVWDPLTDDGDALRLSVALCMNVEVTDSYVFACSVGNFSEPAKPDRNAAVRRAIVRAAAAMASNGEPV